jgi:dinuclear metal center YbgI/SA1388 family protein
MTTRITVDDLLMMVEEIASFGLAETWDNVGLMIGDPAQTVSGILVALDPTERVLAEAVAAGINTIITHHPLIFHPLKNIRTDGVPGRFLQRAMADSVSVVGCHTNLDLATGGVNDVLAATLGLTDVRPLTVRSAGRQTAMDQDPLPSPGFGRWGRLAAPMTGGAFVGHVQGALAAPVVRVAGRLPEEVAIVAVCGGSGSDLAEAAFRKGAQVYVTGEVKLSTARWAEASEFCILDAGHFATENPVVAALADILQKALTEKGWSLDVLTTRQQRDPFVFYHQQPQQRQSG